MQRSVEQGIKEPKHKPAEEELSACSYFFGIYVSKFLSHSSFLLSLFFYVLFYEIAQVWNHLRGRMLREISIYSIMSCLNLNLKASLKLMIKQLIALQINLDVPERLKNKGVLIWLHLCC